MPVTCPHCSTRYVLPRALLGPGGARVRCPRCREPFGVSPEGDAIAPTPAVKPVEAASNGAPTDDPDPARFEAEPTRLEGPPPLPPVAPAAEMPEIEVARAGPPMIVTAPAPRTDEAGGEIEKTRLVGAVAAPAAATAPAVAAAPVAPPAPATPIEVARAVLDEIAAHSGEAIAASRAEGRVFREFGPVIAEAFEFYRRRVGSSADAAPFRTALREKWGVDLDSAHPTGRLG